MWYELRNISQCSLKQLISNLYIHVQMESELASFNYTWYFDMLLGIRIRILYSLKQLYPLRLFFKSVEDSDIRSSIVCLLLC